MPIDPILLVAEEIRELEKQVHATCKRDGVYDRQAMEQVNLMVGRLRTLYDELLEITPTSALGASELIRMAADRLPFAQGRYASHLYRMAERLAAGKRAHADLIWLRALAEALGEEPGAGQSNRTARLLAGTVRGIVASESLVCARIAAFSPPAGRRAAR